jgi:hypothetical protein
MSNKKVCGRCTFYRPDVGLRRPSEPWRGECAFEFPPPLRNTLLELRGSLTMFVRADQSCSLWSEKQDEKDATES